MDDVMRVGAAGGESGRGAPLGAPHDAGANTDGYADGYNGAIGIEAAPPLPAHAAWQNITPDAPAPLGGPPPAPASGPTEHATRAEPAEQDEPDDGETPSAPRPSPISLPALVGWARLAHPATLLLSTAPVLVGLAAVWARWGKLSLPLALCAFFGVALVHAGANILDEYLEFARRSGSWGDVFNHDPASRPLLAQVGLYPLDALRVSVITLAVGALVGVPLILAGGWPIAVLGALGVAVAFLYSATSYALKRLPLGDLAVLLALGPGVMVATILSQRKTPTIPELLVSVALGCFALAVTLISHLRDPQADAANNYRTIVLLAGERTTRLICGAALIAAFALVVVAALLPGAEHGALLALVALPGALVAFSGAAQASSLPTRQMAFTRALRAYAIYAIALIVGLALTGAIFRVIHLLTH
ncbi:MAG TPA: prenyltransferase [Ktedonobacterales bacterium]|nr:prenyltransferase [Ktedonobacterales bacterium]